MWRADLRRPAHVPGLALTARRPHRFNLTRAARDMYADRTFKPCTPQRQIESSGFERTFACGDGDSQTHPKSLSPSVIYTLPIAASTCSHPKILSNVHASQRAPQRHHPPHANQPLSLYDASQFFAAHFAPYHSVVPNFPITYKLVSPHTRIARCVVKSRVPPPTTYNPQPGSWVRFPQTYSSLRTRTHHHLLPPTSLNQKRETRNENTCWVRDALN